MTAPVYAQVKIQGPYADTLRAEADRRGVSLAALTTEYVLEGIAARNEPDGSALAGTEKRIASTMLSLRGDVESLTATVDVTVAMVDALIKLLLVSLPVPAEDTVDGILASAQARHERLLKSVAETGFDEGRPLALQRLHALLGERLGAH